MKLVILLFLWSNILVGQDSISVAVLDFDNNAGIDSLTVKNLTSRFQTNLVNSKTFVVIEREKMREILREQDFSMSDLCSSDACAVEIGQVIGATHIVTGDIAKLGSAYSFNCRLIDVSTGKIVKADSRSHSGSIEGLLPLMDASAQALAGVKVEIDKKGVLTIPLTVKKTGKIKISIYSILGDKVKTLVDSTYVEGKYSIPWDGIDRDGKTAKKGVYIYTIESVNGKKSGKFVLQR